MGLFAAGPSYTGIVSGDSAISVRGETVQGKAVVFPEDDIQTVSDKSATVTFSGNAVKVLGKSHIKLHDRSADLLSGGASINTTNQFTVRSACFSAQPVAAVGTRYFIVPRDERIFIQAEQGDLLIKARHDFKVPSGKTVAITDCGKPTESMQFVDSYMAMKILGGAAAAGALAVPPLTSSSSSCDTQPMSGESPLRCQ